MLQIKGAVAAAVVTYTCTYTLHIILHLSTTCIYCIYAIITLKYKIVVTYSYFTFMKALHDHLLIALHTHSHIYLFNPQGHTMQIDLLRSLDFNENYNCNC